MAKTNTIFVCSSCGNESVKWLGKCPGCGAWNTFYEEKIAKETAKGKKEKKIITPTTLNKVENKESVRSQTGFEELDRVLGGGFVKGSLVLLRWRTGNWKVYINITNL